MTPIFFSVSSNRQVKVIPNTQASVDGHPVITYTYNVYKTVNENDAQVLAQQESELLLEKKTDPNYLGYITFEQPGKLFTYTADGKEELSNAEVEEIIEHITFYRENPGIWSVEEL